MKAPFVWFGGKRRVAPQVWAALGDVDNYVEPFAGSLAVLLGRPHDMLADASVDLVVTSPPYFALRSYQDGGEHYDGQLGSEGTVSEFLASLCEVLDECWRVLKPSGSVFVNLGDCFAGSGGHNNSNIGAPKERAPSSYKANRNHQGALEARPKSRRLIPHLFAICCEYPQVRSFITGVDGDWPQWVCRMDIVWSKPNGLPESVTDRVRASHEYIFHLTRSERYFAAVDEVREPHLEPERIGTQDSGSRKRSDAGANNGFGVDGEFVREYNPLGKLPGSVWSIASEPLRVPDHLPQHFAAFPSELPRRLILGWSPSGICTVCGEGRRPVVASSGLDESRPQARRALALAAEHGLNDEHLAALRAQGTSDVGRAAATQSGTGKNTPEVQRLAAEAKAALGGYTREFLLTRPTSFSYSCACPEPDAPTRPAVVLDPFAGTGTTVAVAHLLGRHGIGIDLSADYLRLAHWRCTEDTNLVRKVTGSEPVKVHKDQLALFEVGPPPPPRSPLMGTPAWGHRATKCPTCGVRNARNKDHRSCTACGSPLEGAS